MSRNLGNKKILLPQDRILYPAQEALVWPRENRLREQYLFILKFKVSTFVSVKSSLRLPQLTRHFITAINPHYFFPPSVGQRIYLEAYHIFRLYCKPISSKLIQQFNSAYEENKAISFSVFMIVLGRSRDSEIPPTEELNDL